MIRRILIGLSLLLGGCVHAQDPIVEGAKPPVLQSSLAVTAPAAPSPVEAKKPEPCPPVYRPVVVHDDFSGPGEYHYKTPNGDEYTCGPNGCVLTRKPVLPGYETPHPTDESNDPPPLVSAETPAFLSTWEGGVVLAFGVILVLAAFIFVF